MKPKDLLKKYGSQNAAAKALGISRQAIHKWFRDNKIPMLRQYQILHFWRNP
jgi:DNA invertase Pin-like site-specific DNA recombinase